MSDGRGPHLWLADHLGLATRVEVTFADPAAAPTEWAARAREFAERASVTAALNEPHVVRVLSRDEFKGVPFMVTQLLEGKSLRARLALGPLTLEAVSTVVQQTCEALQKAHALGVAHGGLRPECLFCVDVASRPFIEIAGFGACGSLLQSETKAPYASPEQLLGGTGADARADLWALAVCAYELLTTTLPFDASTAAGMAVAICNAQFSPPSHVRADLPRHLDDWFARALAKDPASRFSSATELARGFAAAATAEGSARGATRPTAVDHSLELDDGEEEEEKTMQWAVPDGAGLYPEQGRTASGRVSALPPSLEPEVYLESPYIASVASALAVPGPSTPTEPAARRSVLAEGLAALTTGKFTADKTWLAALAFAAGVAVTWFSYDPPKEEEALQHTAAGATQSAPEDIRTLRVDDLPRVPGDERPEPLPAIVRSSQLPPAPGEEKARAAPPPAASNPRGRATVQKVQALSGSGLARAAAKPSTPPMQHAPERGSDCSPPYYFDRQGIQRLKADCLDGSGVITGPYGAVIHTNVSSPPPPPASKSNEKQARAESDCSPPYYFDGKIRRIKLECL